MEALEGQAYLAFQKSCAGDHRGLSTAHVPPGPVYKEVLRWEDLMDYFSLVLVLQFLQSPADYCNDTQSLYVEIGGYEQLVQV